MLAGNPIQQERTVKKLPLWGRDLNADQITFCWPTAFETTNQDVRLASISFKSNGGYIASVQCTLTNGFTSPAFEKSGIEYSNPETIRLDDPKTPIRAVKASSNVKGVYSEIYFKDRAGHIRLKYNPYEYYYEGYHSEHKIDNNQEIIGVYGALHEDQNRLKSFGFLVKGEIAE